MCFLPRGRWPPLWAGSNGKRYFQGWSRGLIKVMSATSSVSQSAVTQNKRRNMNKSPSFLKFTYSYLLNKCFFPWEGREVVLAGWGGGGVSPPSVSEAPGREAPSCTRRRISNFTRFTFPSSLEGANVRGRRKACWNIRSPSVSSLGKVSRNWLVFKAEMTGCSFSLHRSWNSRQSLFELRSH